MKVGFARHALLRYAAPVLAVVLAAFVLKVPEFQVGGTPILVFFLAILASAWYGGLGPGLLATALITLLTLPGAYPAWRVIRLVLFLTSGVTTSVLFEALQASRRRVEADAEELRRREDSLRQSEGRLRLLLESITDHAIFTIDRAGRVTSWSAGAERVLGYTAPEILGQGCERFYTDEDVRRGEPARDRAVALSVGRLANECWRVRRDGTRFWASGVISTLTAGASPGLTWVLRDITEQKRAEQELRLDERRYRTLTDAVLQLMWVNDPEGRTIYFNQRWSEYTGAEPARFSEPAWLELIHPDDRERLREARQRGIQMCAPYEHEYRLKRFDGAYRWHIARVVPMKNGQGGVENWFGTATDIDDRKRAEAELRKVMAAKDQFLATLSHELRTPLTPALISVTAIRDDPKTPEAIRPALEVVRRNILLEARLIDDLLDVTRISQGKLRLNLEVVDVHDLIRSTVEICRDEINAADLNLVLDLRAAEAHVEADPARLQQVLWNLIKNAVKFTPSRGTITIRSDNIAALSKATPVGRLIVEVGDTGIGIEPAVLPRIFNPFEQGDPAVTKAFGGLGLGLAISRSLAESHGGGLSASSPGKGQGATFRLDLPTTRAASAVPPPMFPERQTAPSPEMLRLLLVEDNADTLRVMTRLFRGRGYQVTPAANLASAREAAEARTFDLLVSDIGLPDGSGLDLMRQLRSRSTVKGISLSGYGMEDDFRKSQEAGFSLHLTKPVDFPTLEDAIRRVTRS